MATDFFVILLLVASLAAFVVLWIRLRILERSLDGATAALTAIADAVRSECLPAIAQGSALVGAAIGRLEAEGAAARADASRAGEGVAALLDELKAATARLGEARVDLARAVEGLASGGAAAAETRAGGDTWLRERALAHLATLGVSSVTVEGIAARPDGGHVVRARGMRGAELWIGTVVIKGGDADAAPSAIARMFP